MSNTHLHVLGRSLSSDGPLLRSFGIDTQTITSPSALLALEALAQLGSPSLDLPNTIGHEIPAQLEVLLGAVRAELSNLDITGLISSLEALGPEPDISVLLDEFWKVFAPVTAKISADRRESVEALRRRRRITLTDPPSKPIRHPASQVLFTTNALVTVGGAGAQDPQINFYDHPTPINSDQSSNEICYGLEQLNASMEVERARGNLAEGERVTCLLSVSVTHASLSDQAIDFVRESIRQAGPYPNLRIYAMDERASQCLIEEVLVPLSGEDSSTFEGFGVDGAYGRHYSFLKAISVLWQAVAEPEILATFKFDLDQVFPQRELIETTGKSALEHLANPLWGATGLDSDGHPIELGMLAGALVNQSDIGRGLFTSDTPEPTSSPTLPDLVFCKIVPQSASTEAEMMVSEGRPLERVHVTGGTTGIRLDALQKYQPFTPSFIGRAEDQAYLMGTLESTEGSLRCLHGPGLFMRHDKAVLTRVATESAEVGRTVGDLERIILFSAYARALDLQNPEMLEPFTGAFISRTPVTVATLHLLLKVINRAAEADSSADDLLSLGVLRLYQAYCLGLSTTRSMETQLQSERSSWETFYSCVDNLQANPEALVAAQTILAAAEVPDQEPDGLASEPAPPEEADPCRQEDDADYRQRPR